MENKRMRILLALLGFLLVVLAVSSIWRHRNTPPVEKAAKTVEAPELEPKDITKTIQPTEASKAVDRVRNAAGMNIIICVLDAARSDHMGCYGYPRPTTPNIDRLAKESLVFDQHYCQFPETKASTYLLFRSRYFQPQKIGQRDAISLIAWFQHLGFNTMLLAANPKITASAALVKGFDNAPRESRSDMSMEALTDKELRNLQIVQSDPVGLPATDFFYKPQYLLAEVNSWLAKKPKRPFLTYIHFMPPHIPYDAPKNIKDIFLGKKPPVSWNAPSAMLAGETGKKPKIFPSALVGSSDSSINLYDANLRWADEAVGKLEQVLRKAGLFDNSLLIIMGDHGETLGEHGYNWHPTCPYNEVLHIPLIMHFPGKGAPKGRVKALTQTIDLLPTLFDLHNKSWPATAQGRSLLPMIAGATARANEYSFSISAAETGHEICIVRDLQSTLLLRDDGKTRALYDSVKDPHQTKNILASEPARAARLVEAFRQFALAQPYPPLYFMDPRIKRETVGSAEQLQTKGMPEKLRKQLKILGYLK